MPFVELIDFPDGVGPTIGPTTSAKLYDDFLAFSAKAKKHFLAPSAEAPPKQTKRSRAKPNCNRAGASAAEGLAKSLGENITNRETDDRSWMWKVYRDFRRAFKLARDGGFVTFH